MGAEEKPVDMAVRTPVSRGMLKKISSMFCTWLINTNTFHTTGRSQKREMELTLRSVL